MNIKDYRPRMVDGRVKEYLKAFGAVCIEGPKWCGKTWTSLHHSNSEIFIGSPEGGYSNRKLAQISPSLALQGKAPRLIDEWQEVPHLWDAVRMEVDRRGETGQFILTGSSTPNRKGIMHSGIGRFGGIRMHPMTLFESGKSSGKVSLEDLCRGKLSGHIVEDGPSLTDLADFIIRGGWPNNQDADIKTAALLPKEYINMAIKSDIHEIDGVQRDEAKFKSLLESLARNESSTAKNSTILRDIAGHAEHEIDRETAGIYLDILDRLFLTNNQPPFVPKLRSSIRLKQAAKRHLADPSLAAALLGATPEKLIADLNTMGFLFEALCERDLAVYAQSFDAELYHYQDYQGGEIDAVIQMEDKNWCAIEIKLGDRDVDIAAEKLISISNKIKSAGGHPPSVLAVITGISTAAYQLPSGVFVIPITSLR